LVERARHRAADPACGARDDRNLPSQFGHCADSYSSAVGAVERIERERIVAILRKAADVEATVDELGLRVIEVTLDSPSALDSIGALRARAVYDAVTLDA
jgi:hypothetical protein